MSEPLDAARFRRAVSLVVPVLNEIECLPHFLDEIVAWNSGNRAFVINDLVVVDDGSTDGTRDFLSSATERSLGMSVQVILRDVARGPANAEIAGCLRARNSWIVKMDVDGQHPIRLLDEMLRRATPATDVVVASRYTPGGATDWSPFRGAMSRTALMLSKLLIPGARRLSDPVSGFFVVRSEAVRSLEPNLARYKMLLYLLAAHPNVRVVEVPFTMTDRVGGETKIAGRPITYIPEYLRELFSYVGVSKQCLIVDPEGAPSASVANNPSWFGQVQPEKEDLKV